MPVGANDASSGQGDAARYAHSAGGPLARVETRPLGPPPVGGAARGRLS
jgi:hypothetical protein